MLCSLALLAALPAIAIDYPRDGSIFPPEITAPTFLWRDDSGAGRWRIDITFSEGAAAIRVEARGEMLEPGEIDPRAISSTNELPKVAPAHAWLPDKQTWGAIKKRSVNGPAKVTITGFDAGGAAVSSGSVGIRTSQDPVGTPIFYRDVPLMPSETEKGVIKPLAPSAVRLIQWRLRNIAEERSHVVLENIPTCANCHSFSLDGKTMGMDMDGPANDKGLYALVPLKRETSIGAADMVSWNPGQDRQVGLNRVGFMSQVSPDGQYVLTSVTNTARPPQNNFYVVNFKDYRFLQVFYPTIGILAWYSRATGVRQPLPGADDPRYVQTDGVWSPDGKYVVFARAEAREPYPPDGRMAEYANDPKEVQIRYDLYRVPFNGGKGGKPERIAGASENGMSNAFPRVSPDGRWIVFVQSRNGQLMRPDSRLYIVPASGGEARLMNCNTPLMNSWHSFSPNSRWLVFSSKARSPYTQMYLTHIDENGVDSPPILVENSTAANRAVNLPEFVNIPPDGLNKIDTPAIEVYRRFDQALEQGEKGQYEAAIAGWRQLLAAKFEDARVHNNLGAMLARTGRLEEAIAEYERALELSPRFPQAHANAGRALLEAGRPDQATPHLSAALEANPESADLHNDLGRAFAIEGRFEQAAAEFSKAVGIKPDFVDARHYLGMSLYYSGRVQDALAQWRAALQADPNCLPALDAAARALATSPAAADRDGAEAVLLAGRAVSLSGGRDAGFLDTLAAAYAEAGRFEEAVATARRALDLAAAPKLREAIEARIRLYEGRKAYRE
jgi:tetratricopeptide (TPR) repeat protein